MMSIINFLRVQHDRFFGAFSFLAQKGLEGFVARIVFLSVLFFYFMRSALTKIDGFLPNASAYAQIFPKTADKLQYDVSLFSAYHHFIVYLGTYGELILPVLVVIGFLSRIASLGMIIFIIVQSIVDIWGHLVDGGKPFDKISSGIIADQRLLWVFLLVIIVIRGAGSFSIDKLVDGWFRKTTPTQ